MKKKTAIWLLIVLCWIGLCLPAVADGVADEPWLRLSDNTTGPRYIVDGRGETVHLVGPSVRLDQLQDRPVADAVDAWYAQGANAVRLGIVTQDGKDDLVEQCGGYTDEGIDAFIDKYVDPSAQAILNGGMYLVLTLSVTPASSKLGKALDEAFEKYLPLWVQLVQRYADEPMLAAYDVWDEPYFDLLDDEEGREELGFYFISCVDTIRLYDTRHIIIVSDWNGGAGNAFASQWQNALEQVDSVYHNTAFSVHGDNDTLGSAYMYYGPWWEATANEHNLCLFFGCITLAEDTPGEAAQGNFASLLQGPLNASVFFALQDRLPTLTGWTAAASSLIRQTEQSRFLYEAEQVGIDSYLRKQQRVGAFGRTLYLTGQSAGRYAVIDTGVVFPAGKYQVRVRLCGGENAGPLQIGYATTDGRVVPFAVLDNVQDSLFEMQFALQTNEKFLDFILWKAQEDGLDSVEIDRIVLQSEGPIVIEDKSTVEIVPVTNVPHGTDPTETEPTEPETRWEMPWWLIGLGAVLLLGLAVFGVLWFLGRDFETANDEEEQRLRAEKKARRSARTAVRWERRVMRQKRKKAAREEKRQARLAAREQEAKDRLAAREQKEQAKRQARLTAQQNKEKARLAAREQKEQAKRAAQEAKRQARLTAQQNKEKARLAAREQKEQAKRAAQEKKRAEQERRKRNKSKPKPGKTVPKSADKKKAAPPISESSVHKKPHKKKGSRRR